MNPPTMTVKKAKEILDALEDTIQKYEDEAVALWSVNCEAMLPEDAEYFQCRCDIANRMLTERYTTRTALLSWLARNTPKKC